MRSRSVSWLTATFLLIQATTARAVMDIGDRGPMLKAGDFVMRVTNVGGLGNPFFDVGLSNDPSLEAPAYSGYESLHHAELWVGARNAEGRVRVSGGPLLEWRPTIAEDDTVREVRQGDPNARRFYDDDGDRRVDEEILNGRDEDGDGRIDEDVALIGDQMLAADYRDDELGAIYTNYPGGEPHEPLGLEVHQEAYSWSRREYRGIAAVHYRVTNRGTAALRDVYAGVWADLDSRVRSDRAGQLDDRVRGGGASTTITEGHFSFAEAPFTAAGVCTRTLGSTLAILQDSRPERGLPFVALVPLGHTLDAMGFVRPALARAPRTKAFRTVTMVAQGQGAFGQVPRLDAERYEALRARVPAADLDPISDFSVLVTCGPFPLLKPGESIEFDVALVTATTEEDLLEAARNAMVLHHGIWTNALPDSAPENEGRQWQAGETGTFGHEACLEPPPDVVFTYDPHCTSVASGLLGGVELPPTSVEYRHGRCVWTNADCDFCTPPINGAETRVPWLDVGGTPPRPTTVLTPGDRGVTIAWDNLPEVLLAGGRFGNAQSTFLGYRVYKLSDWRDRVGEFPARANWTLIGAFNVSPADTFQGQLPLATITDSTLAPVEILHELPHYPPGRYRMVDREALNGFHYAYAVTAVYDFVWVLPDLNRRHVKIESALAVGAADVTVPHAEARPRAGAVWVVPNPFRGSSGWDRPPILHDALTRHIDFMGLPRARCTIKIWTLAGDLVEVLQHDGSAGDGQAAWNLVSRNGQDVASGVYLFTVDSPVGQQTGRFVIIR